MLLNVCISALLCLCGNCVILIVTCVGVQYSIVVFIWELCYIDSDMCGCAVQRKYC